MVLAGELAAIIALVVRGVATDRVLFREGG